MVVGGLPTVINDHTERVPRAALEMTPALVRIARDLNLPLDIRIGHPPRAGRRRGDWPA